MGRGREAAYATVGELQHRGGQQEGKKGNDKERIETC